MPDSAQNALLPSLLRANRRREIDGITRARALLNATPEQLRARQLIEPDAIPMHSSRLRISIRQAVNEVIQASAEIKGAPDNALPASYLDGKRTRMVLLRDLQEMYRHTEETLPVNNLDPYLRSYKRVLRFGVFACRALIERQPVGGQRLLSRVPYAAAILPTVKEKLCPGCATLKPAASFNRSTTRQDGLQGHCKICMKNKRRRLTHAGRASVRRGSTDM